MDSPLSVLTLRIQSFANVLSSQTSVACSLYVQTFRGKLLTWIFGTPPRSRPQTRCSGSTTRRPSPTTVDHGHQDLVMKLAASPRPPHTRKPASTTVGAGRPLCPDSGGQKRKVGPHSRGQMRSARTLRGGHKTNRGGRGGKRKKQPKEKNIVYNTVG